jgi:hypothetical protein
MRRVVQMRPLLPLPLGDFEGLTRRGSGRSILLLSEVDAVRTSRSIVWFWPRERSEACTSHERDRTLAVKEIHDYF